MAVEASLEEVQRVIAVALDAAFYCAVHPDIEAPTALRHYSETGWLEGRDPAPWFSTRHYLDANPDVARSGVEPLYHYLTLGRREGREVTASNWAQSYLMPRAKAGAAPAWSFEAFIGDEIVGSGGSFIARPAPAGDPLEGRDSVIGEFDAVFYLEANPDIAASGMDPLDHFLITGWLEGRDPTVRFSVKDYLETYPDIVAARINPFVHYVRTGRAEGRLPRNDLGFRYEILAHLNPVERRIADAQRASAELKVKPATVLARALSTSRTGLKDLHVTFSHDDYTANLGGVQVCLQREGARIAELGRDHLHLYPAWHWPVIRSSGEEGKIGVVWNGRRVGFFTPDDVAAVAGEAAAKVPAGARSFAIHSMLGHATDEVTAILKGLGLTAGYFWLHDFASLCAGYHLLRNDVQDCAAPPPDSAACNVCVYGPWRSRHLVEHERLFERLSLTVVSPSQPTLDLWRRAWSFPTQGEVVAPHARLVARSPAPAPKTDQPFRLAFAGLPVAHKGWPIFRELVLKYEADPRYSFLHLGGYEARGLPMEFHRVVVSEDQPRAMQRALESTRADAVLIWPLCRETFSFTAYEAVAAGAVLVTGPDSGNVAAFVESSGHGLVVPDEAALMAAFESGDILKLARANRRPMLYDLQFSALTVDLIAPDRAA